MACLLSRIWWPHPLILDRGQERRMSGLFDGYAELVRKDHPVHMDTDFCKAWKAQHGNCFGCESEVGCAKAVAYMGIAMLPIIYTPKTFEDFQKVHRRIEELHDLIDEANTPDEVRAVPWV
jgi:hypothetical protein